MSDRNVNVNRLTVPLVYLIGGIGAIISVVLAWSEVSAHVKSDGHLATRQRIVRIEEAVVELKAWRREVAIQNAHTQESMRKLNESVDQLITIQAATLATNPIPRQTRAARERQAQIERNVRGGRDPLHGIQ